MPDSQVRTVPFDTRVYVDQAGHRCRLEAGIVHGPWPQPMWSVALLDGRGMSPIAGVAAVAHLGSREQARDVYRDRLAALRTAGWTREIGSTRRHS